MDVHSQLWQMPLPPQARPRDAFAQPWRVFFRRFSSIMVYHVEPQKKERGTLLSMSHPGCFKTGSLCDGGMTFYDCVVFHPLYTLNN